MDIIYAKTPANFSGLRARRSPPVNCLLKQAITESPVGQFELAIAKTRKLRYVPALVNYSIGAQNMALYV